MSPVFEKRELYEARLEGYKRCKTEVLALCNQGHQSIDFPWLTKCGSCPFYQFRSNLQINDDRSLKECKVAALGGEPQ